MIPPPFAGTEEREQKKQQTWTIADRKAQKQKAIKANGGGGFLDSRLC